MLNDQAITFPNLYQYYCNKSFRSQPLPRYRVLVHVGREFGSVMSMLCRHDRICRMLFRTNSDPYTMLSHALGVNELDVMMIIIPMAQTVHNVAMHLNKKVHSASKHLIQLHKKDPVDACMFCLESFSSKIDSDLLSFFTLLTKPAHEALNQPQSDSHIYSKKLRISFILCAVFFVPQMVSVLPHFTYYLLIS